MTDITYVMGLRDTGEGQTQFLIPCIENGLLFSPTTEDEPYFTPYLPRSQSSASRSLNSVFQPSSTRDVLANYSVDISCSLSLTSGESGTVFLEIASDSGFTTDVQELARFVNGNTGTLTIGLSLTQNLTGTLSGYIPAGFYVRLRTANNTGTPSFTYLSGQEVLL